MELEKLVPPVSGADIEWVQRLMNLGNLDAERVAFLKRLDTVDVSACPGSGKTTLAVAKLAILARNWSERTRGVCVLSHTNVAREEIQHRLGNTVEGQRLLQYPHFIDTIHGFVTRFLAIPFLRSRGINLKAIDDDITASVRRRHMTPSSYRNLQGFLGRKFMDFDNFRLGNADFTKPLECLNFPSGPHTDSYKAAAAAMRYAAEQGYLCYDEIFVLAKALIDQQPSLPEIIGHRFPFVLIDEMQDTMEKQDGILRVLFPRSSKNTSVQRIGDRNQAIFDANSGPVSDPFPDPGRNIGISDSFRFGAPIASRASRFALTMVPPSGLKGVRTIPDGEVAAIHKIFVFPDDDTSRVLPSFAKHAIVSLPEHLLGRSRIAAVGAVHKDAADVAPGHKQFPKTISHYWSSYRGAETKDRAPRTLQDYVRTAQSSLARSGAMNEAVNRLAKGIIHLSNLRDGEQKLHPRSRPHLQICRSLALDEAVGGKYRAIISDLLVEQSLLEEATWDRRVADFTEVADVLVGGATSPSASSKEFVAWTSPEQSESTEICGSAQTNIFSYTEGTQSIDVHLSTIHQCKGQTHGATLIMETFSKSHFLKGLIPWLTGDHENGSSCRTHLDSSRLTLMYVAMTRPTHLLCLAMPVKALGSKSADVERKLTEQGWEIERL